MGRKTNEHNATSLETAANGWRRQRRWRQMTAKQMQEKAKRSYPCSKSRKVSTSSSPGLSLLTVHAIAAADKGRLFYTPFGKRVQKKTPASRCLRRRGPASSPASTTAAAVAEISTLAAGAKGVRTKKRGRSDESGAAAAGKLNELFFLGKW